MTECNPLVARESAAFHSPGPGLPASKTGIYPFFALPEGEKTRCYVDEIVRPGEHSLLTGHTIHASHKTTEHLTGRCLITLSRKRGAVW
jgi:hypothetical protein